MPEQVRAFIAMLVLTVPALIWVRRALTPGVIATADFDRRRWLWFALTAAAFLSNNFWACLVLFFFALLVARTKEPNPLALFCFILYVLPDLTSTVSGVGGIGQILALSPLRLCSVVLLGPAYLTLRRQPESVPFGRWTADKCLLGYIALEVVLQYQSDTLTNTARSLIYAFVEIFLPYYVASRGLRNLRTFKDIFGSFAVAAFLMGLIALFEAGKHWLLYKSVGPALGIHAVVGNYLSRGDTIRAVAAAGHPIILGYVLTVGLAFYASFSKDIQNNRNRKAFLLVMVLGLIATLSRGPWVAAAIVGAIVMALSPGKRSESFKTLVGAAVFFGVLAATPVGKTLLELLPFFGSGEADTIDYRRRLFEVSLKVVAQNPFFGSFNYRNNALMQELVQGEHIIDIVNTYVGVALTYGLVGLALFVMPFVSAAWAIWISLRALGDRHPGFSALGASLLAALAGIVLTIATMSNVMTVPWVFWIVIGLSMRYRQMVAEHLAQSSRLDPRRAAAGTAARVSFGGRALPQ